MANEVKKYQIQTKVTDNFLTTLHPETDADIVIVSEIKDGEKTIISAGSNVQEVLDLLSKKVSANPDAEATESLTKIKIDGKIYTLEAKGELLRGYYFRGNFYTDTTYATPLTRSNTAIYIDILTSQMYTYCGSDIGYKQVVDIPTATDMLAGVLKLYNEPGSNEDGTITQKAITEGVSDISFAVDESDEECLVLNNTWAAL